MLTAAREVHRALETPGYHCKIAHVNYVRITASLVVLSQYRRLSVLTVVAYHRWTKFQESARRQVGITKLAKNER